MKRERLTANLIDKNLAFSKFKYPINFWLPRTSVIVFCSTPYRFIFIIIFHWKAPREREINVCLHV